MANQGKRAWKLQENVAHSSPVTCLALGPTSGRVIVTGGEDRKVNMWAVGKPNVIMSLSGHTTPVESVQFNNSEELVLAGSQSGTLKIWDLEAAKIVRTLTGHKSAIKCLDFHPYGDFVASGSSDTNLKLWDVRRKGCIFTYKGHSDAVNHLRFSPDGRWIISAGQDGVAKLWDLTAGKILNDFKEHTGAVNRIEFHPKEFLLATASADRTVKFWDLETFDMVSSTDPEQSSVRTIAFHPEGHCLFSGSQDALRVYGWEPKVCYESLSIGWGKVSDISFSSNQLIGGSYAQTNMSVWVIDLAHLDELVSNTDKEIQTLKKEVESKETPVASTGNENAPAQGTTRRQSPQRKSFNTRPKTTSTRQRAAVKSETPAVEGENVADEPASYDQVFQPSSALRRSPGSNRRVVEPFKAPDEEAKDNSVSVIPEPTKETQKPTPAPQQAAPIQIRQEAPSAPAAKPEQPVTQPAMPSKAPSHVETKQSNAPFVPPPSSATPIQYPTSQPSQVNAKIESSSVHVAPLPQRSEKAMAQPQNEVAGVNLNDFMPVVSRIEKDISKDTSSRQLCDESSMDLLRKSHESICTIMNARLKNLSIIGQMWTDGEIKTAVQTASSMSDQAILIDLLNVLTLKQTLWNLDICVVVLPQVKQMLSSKYESHVETGCNVIRLVLKSFAPVIKSNMAAPPVSMGCDIVREERYQKCKRCHSYLLDIKELASKLSHTPGKHGALNKQISLALNAID